MLYGKKGLCSKIVSFSFGSIGMIFGKSHQALGIFIPLTGIVNHHLPALGASGHYGYSTHISENHLANDL